MKLVVLFPVGKESEADAYIDFCEVHNPDTGSVWYERNVVDKYGQRVVAYLGPEGLTWNEQPFPEPEGGPEARADGFLSDTVERAEEE